MNGMIPRDGESPDDLARWKWLWGQLCEEISAVHLWPSWETQVFELLRSGLPRLSSIFSHYVKSHWTCIDAEWCVHPSMNAAAVVRRTYLCHLLASAESSCV